MSKQKLSQFCTESMKEKLLNSILTKQLKLFKENSSIKLFRKTRTKSGKTGLPLTFYYCPKLIIQKLMMRLKSINMYPKSKLKINQRIF